MSLKPPSNQKPISDYLTLIDPQMLDYLQKYESQIDKLAETSNKMFCEGDLPILLDMIISEAMRITHSEGGSLYLVEDNERLVFEIIKSEPMRIYAGGISTTPIHPMIRPIRLYINGQPNYNNINTYVGLTGNSVNILDAYKNEDFNFAGTKAFDKAIGHRSKSILSVAMNNHKNENIGVLQLINALDPATGETITFSEDDQKLIESLANLAAIAITNLRSLEPSDLEEDLPTRVRKFMREREEHFQEETALIPKDLDLSSADSLFVKKAIKLVIKQLDDPNFGVSELCKQMFISRQHLSRKLKSLTGQSTLQFIRSQRLKRAALLLENQQATVTEVAYEVGFSNPSYFTKVFRKEFEKTPSAFLSEKKTEG